MSTQELLAETEHAALVKAGWTQRDFALALAFSVGKRPHLTTEIGNLRIGGTVIELIKLQGRRPIFTLVTSVGLITAPAENILP